MQYINEGIATAKTNKMISKWNVLFWFVTIRGHYSRSSASILLAKLSGPTNPGI